MGRLVSLSKCIPALTAVAALATCLAAENPRRALRADGTVLVDDKPFFPFGFYVSRATLERNADVLKQIAEGGYNTVVVNSRPDAVPAVLDQASRLGLLLLVEIPTSRTPDRRAFEELVRAHRDNPAILGWAFGDDAGDHAKPDVLRATNDLLKSLAPNHLTYLSVSGWSKKWEQHAELADLIGGQSYPVGYPFSGARVMPNLPNAISEVCAVFSLAASEAGKYGRPAIANLQIFNWGDIGKNKDVPVCRWPSVQEVYNMHYQALLGGVKGITSYVFGERLVERPGMWEMLKSLVPETKALTPALLDGKRIPLATGDREVLAGAWHHGSQLYVIVVNTSDALEPKQVSLALPAAAGDAKPLFPRRPGRLKLDQNRLSGPVKALEVQVYVLAAAAAPF